MQGVSVEGVPSTSLRGLITVPLCSAAQVSKYHTRSERPWLPECREPTNLCKRSYHDCQAALVFP
jgi:hypothetical protein